MQVTMREMAVVDFFNNIRDNVDKNGFHVLTPKKGKKQMTPQQIVDGIQSLPPDRLGRDYWAMLTEDKIVAINFGRLAQLVHQRKVLDIPVTLGIEDAMRKYNIGVATTATTGTRLVKIHERMAS